MTSFTDGLHIRTTLGAKVERGRTDWARLRRSRRVLRADTVGRSWTITCTGPPRVPAGQPVSTQPARAGFGHRFAGHLGLWPVERPVQRSAWASAGRRAACRRCRTRPGSSMRRRPTTWPSATHPAQGLLAATFRSPLWPAWLSRLARPGLPLLAWNATARLLRRIAGRASSEGRGGWYLVDPTVWHLPDGLGSRPVRFGWTAKPVFLKRPPPARQAGAGDLDR